MAIHIYSKKEFDDLIDYYLSKANGIRYVAYSMAITHIRRMSNDVKFVNPLETYYVHLDNLDELIKLPRMNIQLLSSNITDKHWIDHLNIPELHLSLKGISEGITINIPFHATHVTFEDCPEESILDMQSINYEHLEYLHIHSRDNNMNVRKNGTLNSLKYLKVPYNLYIKFRYKPNCPYLDINNIPEKSRKYNTSDFISAYKEKNLVYLNIQFIKTSVMRNIWMFADLEYFKAGTMIPLAKYNFPLSSLLSIRYVELECMNTLPSSSIYLGNINHNTTCEVLKIYTDVPRDNFYQFIDFKRFSNLREIGLTINNEFEAILTDILRSTNHKIKFDFRNNTIDEIFIYLPLINLYGHEVTASNFVGLTVYDIAICYEINGSHNRKLRKNFQSELKKLGYAIE